ncbi:MAG: hypothetical protein SGILL_008320 [Bacillariaceae sp.]
MVTIAIEDSPPQQQVAPAGLVSEVPPLRNATATSSVSTQDQDAATSDEIPTTPIEQDSLVFGTLNRDLTDFLAERIRHAVQHHVVKELPLLEEEAAARHQLQETLVYKFVRNIDVLEAYCEEKVLTLRNFPPAKRKRIIQVMKKGKSSLPDIALPPSAMTAASSLPTKDMIPSQDDMKDLQQDVQQLQIRLEAARATRNALLAEQHGLDKAEAAIDKVTETLQQHQETTTTSVTTQVNAKVTDGNSVQHLTQEAQTIVEKLDTKQREKRQRRQGEEANGTQDDENAEEDDPFFASSAVTTKQPRLSLEENYRRDCKALGLQDKTNTDANLEAPSAPLAKVRGLKQLLKPSKASAGRSESDPTEKN